MSEGAEHGFSTIGAKAPQALLQQRLAVVVAELSLEEAVSGFNTVTLSHGLGLTGIKAAKLQNVPVNFVAGFKAIWSFQTDQGLVVIKQWFHYIYNDDFPPQSLLGAVKIQSQNAADFVSPDSVNYGLQSNDITLASFRGQPLEGTHGWSAQMTFYKGSDHRIIV